MNTSSARQRANPQNAPSLPASQRTSRKQNPKCVEHADGNFSQRALTDLERLLDFLVREVPDIATETAGEIVDATRILQRHPLIGGPIGNLHELVISKGRTGYVALYRYLQEQDRVDILTIRHQRESGLTE